MEGGGDDTCLALGPNSPHVPIVVAIEPYDPSNSSPAIFRKIGTLFPLEHDEIPLPVRARNGSRTPQHRCLNSLATIEFYETLSAIIPKFIPQMELSRWV